MAESGRGASSSRVLKKLHSEVTCPLCLDVYTDPKKLPCDHVYCRACLYGLSLRSISGTISCPECRLDVQIPTKGADGFVNSHQMNRLIEMYQESLALCEIDGMSSNPPSNCEFHRLQPLALYCETCESLVCRDCVLQSCVKKNHKHGYIDEMVKKYQKDLDQEAKPLKDVHQQLSRVLKDVVTVKSDLEDSMKATLGQIESTFDALEAVLAEDRKRCKGAVINYLNEQSHVISVKQKEASEKIKKIESFLRYIDSASVSKENFLQGISGEMKSISHLVTDVSSDPIKLPDLAVSLANPDDLGSFCVAKNLICTYQMKMQFDPMNVPVQATAKLFLFSNSPILLNNISAQIAFQTHSKAALVKKIAIPGSGKEHLEIAFCLQSRGKHTLIIKANEIPICGSPIPLHATAQLNQLASVFEVTVNSVAGVKCYGGTVYASSLFKSVVLLDSATGVVKKNFEFVGIGEILVDDDFIYATDGLKHRVIKMSKDFRVLKSVGRKGTAPRKFFLPNGIRLSKDDEIYVCDTYNHRIQVFDKQLDLLRILGGSSTIACSFRKPYDLDFDATGNLFVVDSGNGVIQVLTPAGEYIRRIPVKATSVAVFNDLVYAIDILNCCVSVYKTSGKLMAQFGKGFLIKPECITVDCDSNVYVSDNRSRIVKF